MRPTDTLDLAGLQRIALSDLIERLEIGDWIVESRWSGYYARGPLQRVTAQKVWAPRPIWKTNVLFSSTEDDAKLLVARLESSRALAQKEERDVRLRHQARVESLITGARQALLPTITTETNDA